MSVEYQLQGLSMGKRRKGVVFSGCPVLSHSGTVFLRRSIYRVAQSRALGDGQYWREMGVERGPGEESGGEDWERGQQGYLLKKPKKPHTTCAA